MQKYFLKQIRSQNSSSQSGQIAIIVLLIMVVLLIVGLSLARRTSEEILLSGQVEDTTRVFNAAETGVEDALSNIAQNNLDPKNNISVGTDVQYSYRINQEQELRRDGLERNQVATVDLSTSPSSFTIQWAKNTTCTDRAAIIVSVYYDSGASVYHEALKPSCLPADKGTGFTPVNAALDGGYYHKFTISVGSNPVFARIRPLYAATDLLVTGAGQQQYVIRSEGTEQDPDGRSEQRAIEVTRTKPAPPAVFDYALYSGGDLSKP